MSCALIDGFGRRITYARLSVTDRCDFRCRYCMAEQMAFLPRDQLLSFGEIETLAGLLIARGVTRLRLTGGEPLVRRGIPLDLVALLGRRLGHGLDELTLTTNGSQLAGAAASLFAERSAAGQRQPGQPRSRQVRAHHAARAASTRCWRGLAAAKAAGLKVKVNMVALRGLNESEIEPMLRWCARRGLRPDADRDHAAGRGRGGSQARITWRSTA